MTKKAFAHPPLGLFEPQEAPTWKQPQSFPNLRDADYVYVDVETYDPHLKEKGPGGVRRDGKLIGIAIGTATWQGYYPIGHDTGNMDKRMVLQWLKRELSGSNPKIGANILYDAEWLRSEGVELSGPLYDIQTAEALLDENKLSYSLDAIDKSYGFEGKNEAELEAALQDWGFTGDNKKIGLRHLPPSKVGPYAEGDIIATRRCWEKQVPLLKKDGLEEVFDLESRLLPLLLEMRFKGVRISTDNAEKAAKALAEAERDKLAEILNGFPSKRKTVGIWESEDLAKACDELGIVYPRTEKTNAPSFKKEWLKDHGHPFLKGVQECREYNRLRETFVEDVILSGNTDGRIYPQFHPMRKSSDGGESDGTRSGRLSCTRPNVQQMPSRSKLAHWVRGCIIPEDGCEWCKLDFSQQEPRALVHYACVLELRGADKAKDYYLNDPTADFHQMVADMAGIDRKPAKTINLALMYGMGIKKLAASLGLSTEEASKLRAEYFEKIPFVKQLSYECSDKASNRGWIRTLSGRRRHFNLWEPQAQTEEFIPAMRREAAEARWPNSSLKRAHTHKALNALIQGTAADITKRAMVQIWEKYKYVPHLQVHDELGFSVNSKQMAEEIAYEMSHTYDMQIPMVVDWNLKPTWS